MSNIQKFEKEREKSMNEIIVHENKKENWIEKPWTNF